MASPKEKPSVPEQTPAHQLAPGHQAVMAARRKTGAARTRGCPRQLLGDTHTTTQITGRGEMWGTHNQCVLEARAKR